jgi:MOSC domain-containing protein YiiM
MAAMTETSRTTRSDPARPSERRVAHRGVVEAIHIAPAAGAPMEPVDRVRAIAGVGLAGDRYAIGTGHYKDAKVDRQVTLIEAEEIEALAERAGVVLGGGQTRRNLTTRGIRLNELVGRRFRIGAVECEGTRLCEPCQYLTDLLRKPVLDPLVNRAGLRARILGDGEIALGDEVAVVD